MKPSSELFKLIRSLSKSEKRFFKLSSALQSGEKNYLKLFDAIESQKEYDEEAIKELFREEKFIRHLPSEKNHLYKLILRSLRGFHANKSVGSQLAEELKNIEILYEKTLYRECAKIITKAKKLAWRFEKFYYLFELIRWEKIILEEEYLAGNFDRDLNALNDEEKNVIEKLRNLAEYMMLYSKINYVFRKGGYARNDTERAIVREISEYHLIKGKNTAKSRSAAATCYYIQGLCEVVNSNYNKSFKKFSKVVQIFEENPDLILDIPKQYIKSLNNLLICFINRGDFNTFFELLAKIRALESQPAFTSLDVQLKIFTCTYLAELQVYDRRGEYEKAMQLIDMIVERIQEWEGRINKEDILMFYFNFANTYFGAGEMKQALFYLNKVLNDNEPNLRQDVYSFARLFNLLIHYELENFDLLEYALKSTHRYYMRSGREHHREYRFETVFIKQMKQLVKYRHETEKECEIMEAFLSEIKKLARHQYEGVMLNYFDIISWGESKLQGKLIAEIKKARNSQAIL